MLVEGITAAYCMLIQILLPKLNLKSRSYPLNIEEWREMHLHVCVWERVQGKGHSGRRERFT